MSADRTRSPFARLDPRRQPIEHLLAGAIAVLSGILVFAIATELFPHHSANHDEGVYLQQAAMLLEGRLELHAGPIADAVRPWFFVQDGSRLYPKYQPYPAALFAIPMGLFGMPRLALAAVAAGNVALVYVLGAQAFDRRIGVVAAAAFATAPMTLLTTSVFLPYAPTTLLTLAFAVCYLRASRRRSLAFGALAGLAIGLAFFARPYTAVLFAAPFIAHACWQLVGVARRIDLRTLPDRDEALPEPLVRHGATAAIGLAFVGVALAYNVVVTGAALEFPYAAFAPQDGPGFGHREIAGHGIQYTPELALHANGHVLWALFTRWGPAGPIGTVLAAVGIGFAARGWRRRSGASEAADRSDNRGFDATARALLAGLFVTVAAGNVAFWGNNNVLGDFDDPADGLLGLFGPFYHFDLLAPLSIFGAAGLLGTWRWIGEWSPDETTAAGPQSGDSASSSLLRSIPASAGTVRALGLAGLLVLAAIGGGASAAFVQPPVDRHADHTEYLETAYEPFEDQAFDDAVVFVPRPYGDWLNHPFQSLRNDGGLDGDVVYALDRHTASDFAVLDATSGRTPYRYTYRGEWNPGGEPVDPMLQPLEVRSAERFAGETVLGVPDRVDHAAVRLETDPGEYAAYGVDDPNGSIAVPWSLTASGARLEGTNGSVAGGGERLPIDEHEEIVLRVRLVATDGSSMTYRQEIDVRQSDGAVDVIWPSERKVCLLAANCGLEGTYVPGLSGEYVDGTSFETRLRAE
ncbi:glycosyltransferase family 39 protein [Salinarchaeum chitinilyticum]